MRGLDAGISRFKFFPAESSGGAAAVKALAGPFAACRFCPTGGIDLAKAPSYLALPNVICVVPAGSFGGRLHGGPHYPADGRSLHAGGA